MSKNLTHEYEKLANNDLPDLWSRIEAGITDGNTAAPSEEKEVYKDFEVEKIKTVKLEPTSYQNRYIFVRRYGGLIAACLCAAVILPVIFFNRNMHENFSRTDSAGNMAPAPAAFDAAPAEPEAMMDMAGGTSEVDDMDYSTREAGTTAGVVSMEEACDAEFITNESYDGNNELSAQVARENYFLAAQTEKRVEIHKVVVEIYDFYAVGVGDIPNVYSAMIISDEADVLNTYVSIYIVKNEGVDAHLAVGETYTVDLVYEEAVLYFEVVKVW